MSSAKVSTISIFLKITKICVIINNVKARFKMACSTGKAGTKKATGKKATKKTKKK